MSAFELKLFTATSELVSGVTSFALCGAGSILEAVQAVNDSKISSIQCVSMVCASDLTDTHRGDIRCRFVLLELATPAGPLPAGFLVQDAKIELRHAPLFDCNGPEQSGTINPVRDGFLLGFGSGVSCGGTCIEWSITDVGNPISFLSSSYGFRMGNLNNGGLQRLHIDRIRVIGNFILWSVSLTLNSSGVNAIVNDGAGGLLGVTKVKVYNSNGQNETVINPPFIQQTASILKFASPLSGVILIILVTSQGEVYAGSVEVSGADINVIGSGGINLGGTAPLVLISDPSGIYTLVPNKFDDTLITRGTPDPLDVEIPDPTVKLAYLGD